ncbi:translation machinery-associated protein 20 [Kwoniella heveanensis CBS 569]|uniref:Translation machinery-associated protein 20 n=1 Tax=Kwoniella heveanensis BCC8398 TaxID=1296120 RepID=A0A1B9GYS1_9TREE|nr:translation machinery-associated protein 20 [Kwoniella heveanensis BCC8398]OCF45191.1 translation machinery-associated protein 20 [Kwoniella heveanensis CBS 569]
MFKKFNPKEDVSSSTSLKSSVQRNIRSSLLTQIPFLTQASYRDPSTAPEENKQEAVVAPAAPTEEEEPSGGKKGGGKKGGKGKGGKGKGKDKEDKKDKDEEDGGEGGDAGGGAVIDEIWPKKEALGLTKCHDRISIFTVQQVPLFFQHFDGPFIPTLKLLHRYPNMLPHVQIDRGAIKFLLAGANMMAPGLLSAGGKLPDGLAKDEVVAIHAEGKEHACGIGKLVASSEEIKKAAKGVAVEVVCWIGDDLWKVDTIGL